MIERRFEPQSIIFFNKHHDKSTFIDDGAPDAGGAVVICAARKAGVVHACLGVLVVLLVIVARPARRHGSEINQYIRQFADCNEAGDANQSQRGE